MKLFIFGAGASLGSQGEGHISSNKKSPLVDQLFDRVYRSYGETIGLSADAMQECQNETNKFGSVEKWLTHRWHAIEKIGNNPRRQSEINAFGRITFYIWQLFQNISNTYKGENCYKMFLKKLLQANDDFGIITLNYDTLLERAYQDVIGGSFTSLDDYIAKKFIKLHGSVNWLLPKRPDDPKFPTVEIETDIEGRFTHASLQMYRKPLDMKYIKVFPPKHPDLNNRLLIASPIFEGQYFYPLVLLPLTAKLFQNFTGFERIIEEAKKLIKEATEIYLIGYKLKDEIVRDMLKEAKPLARVHVIGVNDAQSIRSEVMELYPDLQTSHPYNSGFYKYVTYSTSF